MRFDNDEMEKKYFDGSAFTERHSGQLCIER